MDNEVLEEQTADALINEGDGGGTIQNANDLREAYQPGRSGGVYHRFRRRQGNGKRREERRRALHGCAAQIRKSPSGQTGRVLFYGIRVWNKSSSSSWYSGNMTSISITVRSGCVMRAVCS